MTKEEKATIKKRFIEAVNALKIRFIGAKIAEETGYKAGTISAYLNPHDPELSESFVRKVSEKLGLDFNSIWYGEMRQQVEENAPSYHQSRLAKKNHHTPYMAPLVSRKAQAGYVKSYDQVEFLDTLEKYALPPGIDYRGAEWRYFEVEGSSMEPTFHSGDMVLASMVPHLDWPELRNFYIYVIVTETQLMIKRVFRKTETEWVLISDNEEHYSQQLISVEDIKEVWVFRRHIDSKAPPPKQFEIKV